MMRAISPHRALLVFGIAAVGLLLLVVIKGRGEHREQKRTLSGDGAVMLPVSDSPPMFPTLVRRPAGPPRIELGEADPLGRTGSVACSTCHSTREPNFANKRPADLDEFHERMPLAHGELACYACHNPHDSDTLRLADSTVVEYADVMTLCAQCHGPQARDYERGAHGGMTGFWDLSRGPRLRNNCIDCHDPHVPAFPHMWPTFKPRDRFLKPPASHAHGVEMVDQDTDHAEPEAQGE